MRLRAEISSTSAGGATNIIVGVRSRSASPSAASASARYSSRRAAPARASESVTAKQRSILGRTFSP
jgi:hypothetical protein